MVVPEHPVIGQRLRPERIDLEPRRLAARLLCGRAPETAFGDEKTSQDDENCCADDDVLRSFHAHPRCAGVYPTARGLTSGRWRRGRL